MTTPDVPEKPRDRYATARRVLHATAFLVATGGILWWLPWPWWAIMCAACETVAFALQPRGVEDEPADTTEVGLQIGCGAIFGLFAGVSWAFIHWKWKNTGVGYVASALVGAVVCGALAFRYGDKFWNWTKPW